MRGRSNVQGFKKCSEKGRARMVQTMLLLGKRGRKGDFSHRFSGMGCHVEEIGSSSCVPEKELGQAPLFPELTSHGIISSVRLPALSPSGSDSMSALFTIVYQ